MSEYISLLTISVGLLFVLFVSGLGAGQYIGVDQAGDSNFTFTQDELVLDLSNASNYEKTYYNSSSGLIEVNKTEVGIFTTDPSVRFEPNVNYDAVEIDASVPEDADLEFKQGLATRDISDGTTVLENYRDDGQFTIVWLASSSSDPVVNATVSQITLLPDSDVNNQSFLNNVGQLFEFSSNNPFINRVILPAVFLVLGLIILSALPFFGG